MQSQRIILGLVFFLSSTCLWAQQIVNDAEADKESYRLYCEKKWKELVVYGKQALASGIDFAYLRMRIGYAAFMIGNYGESLRHYAQVYEKDNENRTALYYCYWNNVYLNNMNAARYYAGRMPEEMLTTDNIIKNKLSQVDLSFSYKSPDALPRGDAQYLKLGLGIELGYLLHWENAVAMYNQTISEPLLTLVNNNSSIKIAQKEFYTKLEYAASCKLALIAGGHYLYTPFNNYIYNNYIGFAGARLTTPFVHLQALAQLGQIGDSSYKQLDAVLSLYPLGNTRLFFITRGAIAKSSALTQVAGVRLHKKIWAEANITVGTYNKLLGNDALYVYNDIDMKKLRAGGSLYLLAGKLMTIQLHYTFDQKELYARPNANYNQYSITGGLQWKF